MDGDGRAAALETSIAFVMANPGWELSLQPTHEAFAFLQTPVRLSPLSLVPDCSRLRGRERRDCQRELRR